ncbi:MAG: amino acid ABC transporter substrate-binding protein [Eubacteriales bacterium]
MKKTLIVLLAVILIVGVLSSCSAAPAASASASAPASSAAASVSASAAPSASAAVSASASTAAADTSLADIKKKGTLILGLDDSFPPMGFKDESGKIVGFDIDLATEVAKRMGVELKLQPIDWKAKEMELNNKNIDVIWNGLSITEDRLKTMLFSKPYMENKQIVVVLQKSKIEKLADLKGKQVAVQDGSSAQDALKSADAALLASIKQIDFKDNVTALMDLKNGNVDALAMDSVVADYYTSKEVGTFRTLDETLAPEQYGVGFRLTDKSFCDEVDKQLDAMKADGTFKTISTKWFGKKVAITK